MEKKDREKILEFLQWNDRNGCFTDINCKKEKLKPLSKKDSLKIFFTVVNEDLTELNPLEYEYPYLVKNLKEKNLYFSTMVKLEYLLENSSSEGYRKLINLS